MQALKQIVQHFLIVAILLATVGFKVDRHYCPITKERTTHFFAQPDCCCGNTSVSDSSKKTCCDNQFGYYRTDFQNLENYNKQTAKALKHLPAKQNAVYFQVNIKPLALAKEPYYTLPPPQSGRVIGILNQVFIV